MAGRTLPLKAMGISALIVALLIGILLQQTSPSTAGPLGILLFFGLLYVLFLLFWTAIIYGFFRLLRRAGERLGWRRPVGVVTLVHSYYYASVLALVPVMLLGVQSIGGVGLYDVVLIGLFGLIGCFYVVKRMPKS